MHTYTHMYTYIRTYMYTYIHISAYYNQYLRTNIYLILRQYIHIHTHKTKQSDTLTPNPCTTAISTMVTDAVRKICEFSAYAFEKVALDS